MEHSDSGQKPDFVFHAYRHCQGCQAIKCYLDSQPAGVLCSNRVSQMTKTYNDIEAVTRLLEEKEKDLELTARIGKELLAHNQKLETNVTSLEAELKAANEKLTQLSHELVKKTELIQILTNDVDESGSEGGTPTSLRCINVELMQRRIGSLEEENKQLRREASQLASDTAECESAEQRLVQDIAQQLANSSMEVEGLSDELDRCKDENRLQQDQIATLTAKLADAEHKLVKLSAENETLMTQLTVSREVQAELASELADSKDRYNEVVALLRETQEQLRKQRKRGQPTVRGCGGGPLFSTGTPQPDSLASELLETSLYSELSTDSGIGNDRGASYRKVFETVRCASRNSNSSSDSPLHLPRSQGMMMMMSTSTTMSSGPRVSAFAPPTSAASHLQSSRYYSSSAFPSLDSVGTAHSDYDSSLATTDTEESYPGAPRTGVPGVPGAADLEAAVRRLTPAEIIARRATLGAGPIASTDYESNSPPNFLPYGCRTPDSIMSTGSSGYSGHSGAWRLPEKLQIVKPMEGSLTLAAWSQLATPTLGGLLEERPGVKIRGGRPLEDLGLEMYTLSDLEEDEEYENPGKSFQNTGSVYTLTNSTVLHPDDNTNVTSSVHGSQMCTAAPSRTGTAVPPTPVTRSRRNSTSTFSTTLGLAKLLNERGIRAVTPSTVCTPCSTFSPTATPCNSPDGSPRSSPPPSPPPFNPMKFPGFLSSGADFLRRTFSAEADKTNRSRKSKRVSKLALSRQEKKALSGIRLVERLESIGLDTILTSSAAPVTPLPLQGSLYTRHNLKSPMAQLTYLKTAPVVSAQEKEPPPSPKPLPILGVPARPGTGALDERPLRPPLKRQATAVRPDLGVVPPLRPQTAVAAADGPAGTVGSSALGTVSQLLFGRKGGLL